MKRSIMKTKVDRIRKIKHHLSKKKVLGREAENLDQLLCGALASIVFIYVLKPKKKLYALRCSFQKHLDYVIETGFIDEPYSWHEKLMKDCLNDALVWLDKRQKRNFRKSFDKMMADFKVKLEEKQHDQEGCVTK